ncbi:MAG: leucine-rich repeat protein [Bacteroidales bacterium]|nr:leucine-rich repeat protein [Bacteroidales bacterium]
MTYDAEGGNRNLRWSNPSATAVLGESFTAPVLIGQNLTGVTYTSSDPAVASISADGTVSIIDSGQTTITASAPEDGMWHAGSASYVLTVSRPATFVSETINVTEPGTLQDLLVDLETRPSELKITGAVNADDLSYINSGTGKIASVTHLDLSETRLQASDNAYTSIQLGSTGIGMGKINALFYIADECHTDTVGSSAALGGVSITYKIYNNTLAGAFNGNKNLRKIILPKDLPAIGEYMFYNAETACVVLPAAPAYIGCNAFYGAKNIHQFSIPDGVGSVGTRAFSGSGLTSVIIPESCTHIGVETFTGTLIREIRTSHITELGASAFMGVPLTGRLDLSSLKRIPSNAFSNCEINEVVFSPQLDEIGDGAFTDNKGLTRLDFPDCLVSVGSQAFYGCDNITEINLPESLIRIGRWAFPLGWVSRQTADGPVIYIGKVAYQLADNPGSATELKFRDGTVSVTPYLLNSGTSAANAFRGGLRRIVFPATMKYVGNPYDSHAFSGCTNLEQVVFNNGLETIGHYAFSDCPRLDITDFPESLRYIGFKAFNNTGISELTLPYNLEYIGARAFDGCTALYSVNMQTRHAVIGSYHYWDSDPWLEDEQESIFAASVIEVAKIGAGVEYVPGTFLSDATNLRKLTFESPEATSPALEIGYRAFDGLSSLKWPELPKRITKIGDYAFRNAALNGNPDLAACSWFGAYAFQGATGINSLHLDSNVEFLGDGAFDNVSTLENVYYNVPTVENSITANNGHVVQPFNGCSNLKTVIIGKDVEYIGPSEFSHNSFVELAFEERNDNRRTAPSDLLIDENAFSWLPITSLILPDCRTAIGDYAFNQCKSLSALRLGNGTENIGTYAFAGTAISSVDFPETFIAFSGHDSFKSSTLKTAYFHTSTVPAGIAQQQFPASATVYVPYPSVAAYKALLSNTVLPLSVTSFALDRTGVELENVGDAATISATVSPTEYNGLDITWTTSDAQVACVDRTGRVTATGTGKAVITAGIAYMPEFHTECTVTVKHDAGLSDIEADNNVIGVICSNGVINILNAPENSTVTVYTADGRIAASTTAKSIDNLANGFYIVNVQGLSFKVFLK